MSTRTEGTTVACPFVYGSIAHWMGKKADEFATHKWTLYIRGPNMEDLSSFISKVVFTLHPSFAAPIREITDPPYQVSEFGWGEFEAGIRIFFRDQEEQPIDLIHQIKLYPAAPEGVDSKSINAPPPQNSKKPVVSEQYDEVVFTDPTESFKRLLMLYSTTSADNRGTVDTVGMENYMRFDDSADLEHLAFVQDHISREIDAAKMRLLMLDVEINQILSDPNAILKPSSSVFPPVVQSAFVPSPFSSTVVAGSNTASATNCKLGTGAPGVSGSDKASLLNKNNRGVGLSKVSSGKVSTTVCQSVSSNSAWGVKNAESQVGATHITASNETVKPNTGVVALSKKKAQASAAAAAAVKQMEQFCSVRM